MLICQPESGDCWNNESGRGDFWGAPPQHKTLAALVESVSDNLTAGLSITILFWGIGWCQTGYFRTIKPFVAGWVFCLGISSMFA